MVRSIPAQRHLHRRRALPVSQPMAAPRVCPTRSSILCLVLWLGCMAGCAPQNVVRARVLEAGGRVEWVNQQVVAIDLSRVSAAAKTLRSLPEIQTVRRLSLRHTSATADLVRALPAWPLERLDLGGTSLQEAPVARFRQLEWLSLAETRVRDHSPLRHLGRLTTLALSPLADDAALSHAGSWPRLRTLYASGSRVRGGGLEALTPKSVPELRTLYLADTSLDDADLLRLPVHERLERIVLRNTLVGDRTAERLTRFPRLDYIDMSSTGLTDAGLMRLTDLQDLYVLDVDGSQVTPAGLEAFVAQRPDVRVAHRALTPPRTAEEQDLEWLAPAKK